MTSGSIQSTSSSVSASPPPTRTTTPPTSASKSVLPTASSTTAPSSVATNFDDDYNEWELGIGDLIIDLDADIEKNNSQPNGSASSSPLTEIISRPMEANTPSQPEMRHMSTCTSVGTVTEPDCLGPCEPGTSVTLEGIVWQETEGGVLVVNVTWRGKTYVGTLLDCTKHDWAPPRFCESPTSDIEAKASKNSRAKRGRTSVDLRSVQSKLRNGKGRRTANSNFTVPASPVKCEAPTSVNGKRKSRPELELSPVPDSAKNGNKRNRSQSRNTPTPNVFSNEPTTPTMHAPSLALIECPEPNCSKKYKHINGLKYHQTRAHSGLSESTNKTETDSTDPESNKDSVLPSDSEEATTEASSVPPSPSSKNASSKSGTITNHNANNSESASDPKEANRNNNSSESANQESSVTFQPICDPKTANSSAGSPMSDELNDTPMDTIGYSPSSSSPSHRSTVTPPTNNNTSSSATSSGLSSSSTSHTTSSTPSATFLVPSSGSQGNLSNTGPLKPLPSKPISVDYVNSDNGKRKKSKHKKRKKDKDRERDRDKDKKSKHEGSSEGVPGIKVKVLGYPMDPLGSNTDSTGQSSSDQVPMDTSPSGNSCGSPVDNANSDTCNIENVGSPAYSDISDANDTETELKPSVKPEEPVVSTNTTSSDNSTKSTTNNFGIYPFFNQTPYILPVGSTSGDKTAASQPPYSDKQNQDPSSQSQSTANQPSTSSTNSSHSSKSSSSSSPSPPSSALSSTQPPSSSSLSSQPSTLLPSQSTSISQQSSQPQTRNPSPPIIANTQQPIQQSSTSSASSSISSQQSQNVNSSEIKKSEISRSSGPTDPRRPRDTADLSDKKRDDKSSSRNNLTSSSSSSPPNNLQGSSSTLPSNNTNPTMSSGQEYAPPMQGSFPYPYGFMPNYPGYSIDPAYHMHLLATDPHYKHQYERVTVEQERHFKEQHMKLSDNKGDQLKDGSQLGSNDKVQSSPAIMGLDLATKASGLGPNSGDLRITPTSKSGGGGDTMLITNVSSKDKMDSDVSNRGGMLKDNHDITVEPQLIKSSNSKVPLGGGGLMAPSANYPNSLLTIYDKSKDDIKRFYVVDHSKNEDSSPRVPSLSGASSSSSSSHNSSGSGGGPPPLKRDDSHSNRDNIKMESSMKSSSSSSSILNIPQGSKIPMSAVSNSVMSSLSNASSSSISSPKNAAHHHPSSSSNSSFSSSSSSKKDHKSNSDERDKDRNKHHHHHHHQQQQQQHQQQQQNKNEGVKPTMETTGPPPPPTNSYYLSSAYLQHPSAHSPFGAHMPFDPNHPLFRPGAMNPPVMSHPYGGPPYIHPQLRYHHGPPGSSPSLDISHFHLN